MLKHFSSSACYVLSFCQLKRMLCAVLQVNFQPGNIVSWGNAQLELLQYHFHTPSEHAWDGQRSAMEAHLVHRNTATGGSFVVWQSVAMPLKNSYYIYKRARCTLV